MFDKLPIGIPFPKEAVEIPLPELRPGHLVTWGDTWLLVKSVAEYRMDEEQLSVVLEAPFSVLSEQVKSSPTNTIREIDFDRQVVTFQATYSKYGMIFKKGD